jgi:dipeptidyl aminopeptidase/acylaminoacyl peptidase
MSNYRKSIGFLSICICTSFLLSQSLFSPTATDVATLDRPGNVQISGDGTMLLYTLRTVSRDSSIVAHAHDNDGGWILSKQLYTVPVSGGSPKQLTFKSDVSKPRWSPDGRHIAFLRCQNDSVKLHVLPTAGGEARIIDTGKLEPIQLRWSPSGRQIAFTAVVTLSQEEKNIRWESGHVVEYDHQWPVEQLHTVKINGDSLTVVTGKSRHVIQFEWSPDGQQFAVITSATSDPYLTNTHTIPSIISAAGDSVLRVLEEAPRVIESILWSPDGNYVAYETTDNSPSLFRILRVQQVDSVNAFNAAAALDPTLSGFVWGPNSRSLIAHVYERTQSRLYQLPLDTVGAVDLQLRDRVINGEISIDDEGLRLAFLSSTFREASSPTIFSISEAEWSLPTVLNPQVSEWNHGTQEVVSWINPEGQPIEGLLYVTPHAPADRPPPLMVFPHGGPDWLSTEGFNSWVTYFANQGYSVFRPNYRGGLGYGFDFYAANRNRLGEIEELDIESGVYHLIALKKADPDHMVVGGWSWGGYLTTWLIAHTDRYKAAVVGAGVSEVVNQYVTSDINHGVIAQWEFNGNPWMQPGNFDRANPIRMLQNVSTPVLIFHGEDDKRVGFDQGLTLYRALQDLGSEVRFFAYPDEPHGFKRPAHVIHMLTNWAGWYMQYSP